MNGPDNPIGWCDYNQGWIEAMIDGEGSLSLFRERRPKTELGYSYKPTLSIGSNDKILVDRVYEIVGEGSYRPNNAKLRKHTLWQYSLQSNGLRRLLPKIRLLTKEKQRVLLLDALAILKERNGGQGRWHRDINGGKRLIAIWEEIRRLNQHEWTKQ